MIDELSICCPMPTFLLFSFRYIRRCRTSLENFIWINELASLFVIVGAAAFVAISIVLSGCDITDSLRTIMLYGSFNSLGFSSSGTSAMSTSVDCVGLTVFFVELDDRFMAAD